jgi:Trypsin
VDKKSKLINEKLNYQADPSWVSKASISCPPSSYQLYSTRGYQYYPEKTMGILIFLIKGVGYSCSASLINKRMILTAAHCVSSDAAWHTQFLFVPGFNNGDNYKPYGIFSASQVLVYSGWFNNKFEPSDYAIIVLKDNIGDQLGWLGFVSNVARNGQTWDQFGYPGTPVSDGMTLIMNRSAYAGDYCSTGTPCNILVGSGMVEGSSGGPWILWLDNIPYANSVESLGDTSCKAGASPYFDTHASNLYKAAQSIQ